MVLRMPTPRNSPLGVIVHSGVGVCQVTAATDFPIAVLLKMRLGVPLALFLSRRSIICSLRDVVANRRPMLLFDCAGGWRLRVRMSANFAATMLWIVNVAVVLVFFIVTVLQRLRSARMAKPCAYDTARAESPTPSETQRLQDCRRMTRLRRRHYPGVRLS